MSSDYASAFRRFWWLVGLGIIAAALAAAFMMRTEPIHTASARLFVTSNEAPYLRTGVTRTREAPIGTDNRSASFLVEDAPDVTTLVDAANVYPLLVESDDVSRLRNEMFGPLPGELSAAAIFSTATASRFRPSEIPIIVLNATADTPERAIALANGTAEAFRTWVVREQRRAGIPPKQRILVQELDRPTEAVALGGSGVGVPFLAALAILTAFAAGAILLDRNFPRPADSSAAGEGSSDDGARGLEPVPVHAVGGSGGTGDRPARAWD